MVRPPFPLTDHPSRVQLPSEGLTAAVFSRGIQRIPCLREFFGFTNVAYRPRRRDADRIDVVLAWGNKETGRTAQDYAHRNDKPLWRLEDGFLRSVESGPRTPPLSLVLDDRGIYYDASQPSRLEDLLNGEGVSPPLASTEILARAEEAIDFVTRERLSKYNDGSTAPVERGARSRVLVIDQTVGDASVSGGLAGAPTFRTMLGWALDQFPNAQIIVKTHPDVIAGRKKGYLPPGISIDPRIEVRACHDNPLALLESVDHVVTATSQLGFEALLLGKPVTCFGAPFYSGWGLTDDRVRVGRRKARRSLHELVAAAWLLYPRYVHPTTGQRCELEDVLEHLALQRRQFARNAGRTFAVGFSPWKRQSVAKFLGGPDSQVCFLQERKLRRQRMTGGRVVVWGQRSSATLEDECTKAGAAFLRMEDGFLRSVELGSDLTPASSLVIDGGGMYYDPTRPSDLEKLLETRSFTEEERNRAAQLRNRIVRARVSKYNVQHDDGLHLPSTDRRKLLVIGQVDDDASVRLGSPRIGGNASLVRRVRNAYPEAFLVYKPHPDVLSGNRLGALSREEMHLVDHVETRASIVACLDAVDEVHTMTSLVGFEALLRSVPVYTYGLPFYAGWGLTHDMEKCSRRTRRLTLDELAFATLIEYPIYYSPTHDCFVTAEQVVDELERATRIRGRDSARSTLGRSVRRLGRYLKGRLRAF